MPQIQFPIGKDSLPDYNSIENLDFLQAAFLLIFPRLSPLKLSSHFLLL